MFKQGAVWFGAAMAALVAQAGACPEGECSGGGLCSQAQSFEIGLRDNQPVELTGSFEVALPGTMQIGPGAMHGFAFTADDEHTVQVIVSGDGKIKVIRDGEVVSPDRIERDGDVVRIRNDDGNVESEIQIEDGLFITPRVAQPGEHPPVMIGVTMGEPDEALRSHLGLGDRRVIMLDQVIDGLPAAEAGLRRFDIIVAIDGSDDDVTPARLLEALKKKNPGDEIKLRVIRGSGKETYTLRLRAYDEAVLSQMPGGEEEAGEFIELMPRLSAPSAPGVDIEELMGRLRGHGLSNEQMESIKQALRRGLAESRRVEILRGPQGNMIFQGPDGQQRMIEIPESWQGLRVPGELRQRIERVTPDRGAIEQRMAELERRMEAMSGQIEERLDRVLRRVEEMTERVERRLRDGG